MLFYYIRKYFLFLVPILIILYFYFQIFMPVFDFPTEAKFSISKNDNGETIFNNLKSQGFVSSTFYIKVLSKISRMNRFYPEDYLFDHKLSVFEILKIITTRPPSVAVLIPEGFTKKQIGERIIKYVKKFDQKKFLENAKEGYLFPDTYFFYSSATNEEILKEFSDKFYKKTFLKFGRSPTDKEVITASILEREAKDPKDMQMIAGIYKNRLAIGMALQVDATVLYGRGYWKEKTVYSDLNFVSKYNTYLNKGLPPGPISNPGLDAINAAMNPIGNDYLYYLTGRNGKMYYAKTHDEHIKNKYKYLK